MLPPARVLPSAPLAPLTSPIVGGVPTRGLPTAIAPIRPGIAPTTSLPALTSPSVGTQLGTSNGLGVVRPGQLVPGGVTGTPNFGTPSAPNFGTPTGVVPSTTIPTRPGGIVTPGVTTGVVGTGVGVVQPTVQQSQGTFLDRILGGSQVQVSPNGIGVGQQAAYGQPGYGYAQPGMPMRGTPGMTTMPPGYGLSTPNGTCLPQSNGLVGLFDTTIGAGLKHLFGVRDYCWGPGVGGTVMPGVGQDGRYMVPQTGLAPGGVRPMPSVAAPGMVGSPALSPGVQLTRPMPSIGNPRAFQ